MPEAVVIPARGSDSQEIAVQEEREKSSLGALYMAGQIPDTPTEPSSSLADDLVDLDAKTMLLGQTIDELAAAAIPTPQPTVLDLVAKLTSAQPSLNDDTAMFDGGASWDTSFDISSLNNQLQSMPPEQMQHMRLQFQQQQQQSFNFGLGQPGWDSSSGSGENWNNLPQPLGMPAFEDERRKWGKAGDQGWGNNNRGRGGGRGGFRNARRKPCSFFQSGGKP